METCAEAEYTFDKWFNRKPEVWRDKVLKTNSRHDLRLAFVGGMMLGRLEGQRQSKHQIKAFIDSLKASDVLFVKTGVEKNK